MTDSMRIGIRFGLFLGIVGVLLALPTLSGAVRVEEAVSGGGTWFEIVANLVPLLLFALLGGLAKRRGLSGGSAGLWAGIAYGLVYGTALYGIAELFGNKQALAQRVWNAYLSRGYPAIPGAERQVTAPILHPDPLALIVGTALELALVGLVAGFVGALLTRAAPGPRGSDTP